MDEEEMQHGSDEGEVDEAMDKFPLLGFDLADHSISRGDGHDEENDIGQRTGDDQIDPWVPAEVQISQIKFEKKPDDGEDMQGDEEKSGNTEPAAPAPELGRLRKPFEDGTGEKC